jgi:diguanylate cyclase (GGDEF)-like protein/PAS domain S-box-containing protein
MSGFDATRLMDLMPGLIAYIDRDLRIRYANQRYADLRGIDRHALIGMFLKDVVSAENFAIGQDRLTDALQGRGGTVEYDLPYGDKIQRVQAEYVPDFDGHGNVCGIMAFLTELSPRPDLHQRIADSEGLFEDAFSNSPIGMALVDTLGNIVRANRNFADMLQRSEQELTGMSFSVITHPDDIDADIFLFRQVLAGTRNGYRIDKRYLKADGGIVETTLSVTAMRNAAGEIVRFVSQIEDITEQRQAQRRLTETNAQLSLALDALSGGMWHMDLATNHFQTSEQLAHYIAGSQSQPLGLDEYLARINSADQASANLMPLMTGELDSNTAEYRLDTVDGERWMRCSRRLVRDDVGKPRKIVGVAIDISREREQIRRSEVQAHSDSLTGLLNRRGFEKRSARANGQGSCAILAIDLDAFKQVNDRYGHAAGDQVLTVTARRLQAVVRDGDIVARLGGDEFVVMLADADEPAMRDVSSRILASLHDPISIGDGETSVGCSIGALWLPSWPDDVNTVHARADAALYEAKAAGKNTIRFA